MTEKARASAPVGIARCCLPYADKAPRQEVVCGDYGIERRLFCGCPHICPDLSASLSRRSIRRIFDHFSPRQPFARKKRSVWRYHYPDLRGRKDLGTLSQTLLENFLQEVFKTFKNFQQRDIYTPLYGAFGVKRFAVPFAFGQSCFFTTSPFSLYICRAGTYPRTADNG